MIDEEVELREPGVGIADHDAILPERVPKLPDLVVGSPRLARLLHRVSRSPARGETPSEKSGVAV